ncbi:17825_t:CDS:10, partial [Funneliformis geosporum]
SEGGGRKGIRNVENPDNFKQTFAQVQVEVPGSLIFIMRFARDAHHLEVQVLADQYGNAISLFERNCSETFESMESASVRLAKLVDYVEHPTKEMVSGVNLPAQLQIAMRIPLHQIRSEIDFDFSDSESLQTQRRPAPKRHVITRITAENPDADLNQGSLVWCMNLIFEQHECLAVNSAGGLHEFADSQFGHIFAYGENCQQSRKNMIVVLKELWTRGDFRTTVEYLVKLLETQTFEENRMPDKMLAVICGAVTKAYTAAMESIMRYKRVHYQFTVTIPTPDSFTLYLNGSRVQVSVRALTDGPMVMKMYMPLIATEDGIVQFIKQQNSTLESGDIIEILTLDDPNRVKHILECILDGYDNQAMLQSSVKELIELLDNSDLPYLEFHAMLSALSGRIPAKLEAALLRISNETHSQGLEYPVKRLKEMIDNYSLDFIKPSDLSIKYHMLKYSNKREEAVHALRISVLNYQIRPANVGQALDKFYSSILKKLAELGGSFTTKVALKARELLIHCHLPSYEERYAQMGFAVFDVLPNFIYHQDSWIKPHLWSLGTSCYDYSPTDSVESPLFFSMRRSASISDLSYLIPKTENEPLCVGAMLKKQLKPLIQRHSYELCEHGIRRITIVLFRKGGLLVRPDRLRNSVLTADYLISESDRLLNEILD